MERGDLGHGVSPEDMLLGIKKPYNSRVNDVDGRRQREYNGNERLWERQQEEVTDDSRP